MYMLLYGYEMPSVGFLTKIAAQLVTATYYTARMRRGDREPAMSVY